MLSTFKKGALFSVLIFISCQSDTKTPALLVEEEVKDSLVVPVSTESSSENTAPSRPDIRYPFQPEASDLPSLDQRIAPPPGYQRITISEGSFAEWLRYLPLHPADRKVHLYNGALKGNQAAHAAIINIDVGKRDLQQCADAVMRLRGEYLYSLGAFEKIHFNYTSGDRVAFDDWSQGRKPRISGNKVLFSSANGGEDTSYKNFRAYMDNIFSYAGTASLSRELLSVPMTDLQAGDVFIQGGFPGHAVIVLDVAEKETGEKCFLLAQSYMPAQEMHVLQNPMDANLSPWYAIDFGADLITPEWRFKAEDLKRFGK